MTRNRIFTDGLLSYIKRPGSTSRTRSAGRTGGTRGASRARGSGRPGGTCCAIRTGITLRSGGPGRPIRARDALGSGRAGGPHGPGGTGRSTAGRRRRRTRWRAALRLGTAGQVGDHLSGPLTPPGGRMITIHDTLLFPDRSVAMPQSILCPSAPPVPPLAPGSGI